MKYLILIALVLGWFLAATNCFGNVMMLIAHIIGFIILGVFALADIGKEARKREEQQNEEKEG